MKRAIRRLLATLAVAGPVCAAGGCATTGPGTVSPGYVGVDVGGDYYEPYGYDYGGWGGNYYVGPYRDRGFGGDRGHGGFGRGDLGHGGFGHGGGIPSIPGGGRGGSFGGGHGGGFGGGGHGGGGHGR